MKIGYVRVSSIDQNTLRQEELMEQLGVERIYIEKVSGKNTTDRPQLTEMMEYVREGDTVIVESISRFARNTMDLLELVDMLGKKKVEFVSQKESIDTSSPQGRFVMTIWAAMAEFERDSIRERQREGIEIAKKLGKYKGRKPIEVDWDKFSSIYKDVLAGKTTNKYAMTQLDLKRNTYYKFVNQYKLEKGL